MRDLMSLLTMNAAELCGPLPAMTFFRPKENFFKYLSLHHPDKPIIDVGAGTGELSKALAARGRKVLAIDPFERDGQVWQVVPFDATTFNYPAHSLPIMARPCHGFWVESAICQALKTVPEMLYVGLSKNFKKDLGGLHDVCRFTILKTKVGEDGERIVIIKPR